jgi:hypothetical protein
MTKKIIIGIVVFFVITAGLMFWISSGIDQTTKEASARTEADFTTEKFIVKELWEMQNTQNGQVQISYLFVKPEEADINLRLPWEGSKEDENALARKIKPGGPIEVKVLKGQLASARETGAMKAIGRFIMGDKKEVTIFNLKVNGEVLVNKDIHDYDEAKITLFGRLLDNPWILLAPIFILFYIIAYVKKKNELKKKA